MVEAHGVDVENDLQQLVVFFHQVPEATDKAFQDAQIFFVKTATKRIALSNRTIVK